jgi:hypothetical protein
MVVIEMRVTIVHYPLCREGRPCIHGKDFHVEDPPGNTMLLLQAYDTDCFGDEK